MVRLQAPCSAGNQEKKFHCFGFILSHSKKGYLAVQRSEKLTLQI